MFQLFRRLLGAFGCTQDRSEPNSAIAIPSDDFMFEGEAASRGGLSSSAEDLSALPQRPANFSADPVPAKTNPAPSIEDLKQVLNVLRAYVVTFGRPEADLELRAVIGAIVANLATVQVDNRQLEAFIDQAIAAFKSLGLEASLVDVSAQLLAEQVAVWLREQEVTISNVVSAYLQHFAPDNTVWNSGEVIGLAQTVVATLNDGSLSRSGGRVLVDRVIKSFDLEQALSRWVAPEWVALAQQVASYVSTGDVQLEVRSIAWAYIQQFQAILSPQLIQQIIKSGPLNVSPEELLSGDLFDFSRMLYYKFQLLEADPVVTKSHAAIAADVHRAIADLQARREPALDVSKGIQTGPLEVTSSLDRTGDRPEN
ncbi:MAG: hypothetical protein WBC73_02085 [Phormidesmis sp.]